MDSFDGLEGGRAGFDGGLEEFDATSLDGGLEGFAGPEVLDGLDRVRADFEAGLVTSLDTIDGGILEGFGGFDATGVGGGLATKFVGVGDGGFDERLVGFDGRRITMRGLAAIAGPKVVAIVFLECTVQVTGMYATQLNTHQ